MNETVTLQTLLIAVTPIGVLVLISLFAIVGSGSFAEARRRVFGQTTRMRDLEQRVATLETALKRARAAELPLEIEAARLAEEVNLLESEQRGPIQASSTTTKPPKTKTAPAPRSTTTASAPPPTAVEPTAVSSEPTAAAASAIEPIDVEIELPPDPDETEEDRVAREQLEAEERERIAELAAQEARIREEREAAEHQKRERVEAEARRRQAEQDERDRQQQERERQEAEARAEAERIEREAREEAERVERERLEAEAKQRHDEEQQRKAEEFRRRVADATPKIVLSAGGSNREAVTVNVEVTNNLTPKHAEISVLSASWAQTPAPATFETQRKDGLYEERWPKHPKDGATPGWGTYRDSGGRAFEAPEDAPTDEVAWIVISYDRTAGGPASTWQRFEVGGAGALWYVRQAIGDPIVIEAHRAADEAAA